MKKVLTTLIVALTIVNCSPDADASQTYDTTLTIIANDNLFGAGNEGIYESYKIITDDENWNTLKNQMDYFSNTTDSFLETEIDFSNYIVLAVFDQIRISSGYSIELDVSWNSDNILVSTTKLFSDENLIHRPTQPFHIVKISTTDLPILFQ